MMRSPGESPSRSSGCDTAAELENAVLRRFQAQADEISHLILNTDLPWVDIAIRIEQLRWEAERLFPDKMRLFEMIYVNRFKRLWQQWRETR